MTKPMASTDADFVSRLENRLVSASLNDRRYERPMNWEEIERLHSIYSRLRLAAKLVVDDAWESYSADGPVYCVSARTLDTLKSELNPDSHKG